MIVSILVFLIIFTVIVVSHEFGHFAVARRGGIRVLEFDIGMGPEILHRKGKETDLSIRLLPVGGACVFEGMDGEETPEDKLDEHSFKNAKVGTRIATVLAGPMANFLLGYLFALIIVAFSGTDLPVIREIIPDSAAQEAGLLAGDEIVSINGSRTHIYREVSLESMMSSGQPMRIVYRRDGVTGSVDLVPKFDEEAGRYLIGLIGGGEYHKCEELEVFPYAFYEAEYWARATWKSLRTMVTGSFSLDDLSGPVGMVQMVDDTYQSARPYGISVILLSFLNLATLLTINLGILNLLPLPALDGGRLLFLLIEAVRGKPVPPDKEGLVHLAGAMALVALMVAVLFNDIARLFR